MQALDKYIDKVKSLPPAPRVLTELLPLLAQDNVDSSRVVELITFDPALTLKVLSQCNSATMGLSRPVEDLPEAVTRLGFNDIYRQVATVVSESTLGAPQLGYGIGPGELWHHSAVTAIASKVLARELDGDENLIFTAALLHDIGKLVLSASLEGAYAAVLKETEQSGHSFLEAETLLLGVHHGEVGGRLLQRWNFPENLVQAIWHHHDPVKARPHQEIAAFVHIGDMIAHLLGCGHGHQAHAIRGCPEAFEILKLSSTELESLMLQTQIVLNETKWVIFKEP